MPATIVVALQNTERGRDMTPPAETDDEMTSMIGDSGGADDFIAFFRDELIPYVDSNYRTTGYDILVGHSLGGLVAIHALVHHPDVFEAYVPISPRLWWDGQMSLIHIS